jgi:hypothetical protein
MFTIKQNCRKTTNWKLVTQKCNGREIRKEWGREIQVGRAEIFK